MPNTCHIYREYWGIAGNNNTLDSEYNREDIEVICGRVKYYVWNLPLSASIITFIFLMIRVITLIKFLIYLDDLKEYN